MDLPKPVAIGIGAVMLAVGVWQISRGLKECNGTTDLEWSKQRATSVDVGDFNIKIPPGWRDAAESGNQKMKDLLAKQPGAHVLVREEFDAEMVILKAAPNEPITGAPPCDELANTLAKAEGSTASAITVQTYNGDPGCRWNAGKGEVHLQYNVRFHGPSVFLVACSGDGAICTQVLAGVTAKK